MILLVNPGSISLRGILQGFEGTAYDLENHLFLPIGHIFFSRIHSCYYRVHLNHQLRTFALAALQVALAVHTIGQYSLATRNHSYTTKLFDVFSPELRQHDSRADVRRPDDGLCRAARALHRGHSHVRRYHGGLPGPDRPPQYEWLEAECYDHHHSERSRLRDCP